MNIKHQIFTPIKIVIDMLDRINYYDNLYGKKVLEGSCGDGSILIPLVRRYIEASIKESYTFEEIKKGLEKDIFAVEIDFSHYERCLKKLNQLSDSYGIYGVKWNLYNADSLKHVWDLKFDIIIGNPPYIKYHDMTVGERIFLREKYKSCEKGNFDYYYAFIEESVNCLNEKGKMIYLIPNNMFKNVFANTLRNLIKDKLTAIHDYTNEKIFGDILTSSAIIVLDNSSNTHLIEYHNMVRNSLTMIEKSMLKGKWVFLNNFSKNRTEQKFGDYFNAAMPIATLLNNAFILKNYKELDDYHQINNHRVENSIVREAASPRGLYFKRKEKVIFPYFYKNEKLKRYTLEEFDVKFPQTVAYLKTFKNRLLKRNVSNNTHWFEYGRTQALQHLNQPKLLLSTVITSKVNVYELDKKAIPYSGIYIIPKSDMDLKIARKLLETKDFYDYINSVGVNTNSNSMRITAKDINMYPIKGALKTIEEEL